jgi:FkbM family methyltransferase
MNNILEILKAFVTKKGMNDARLPYNINWMIKDTFPIASFLEAHPLVVADIGARGGSLGELENLKKFIRYFAFDADTDEAERLSHSPPAGFHSFEVFPFYVGRENGLIDFHIFHDAGHSSLFKPSSRFKNFFSRNQFDVKETVKVESKTLDAIIQDRKLEYPDIIKLDTQGTELDILSNAENTLSQATLVEVEVEFIEMYQNQPLMHDVMKFMYDRGFELLYLNRVFGGRTAYPGQARGQLIFGDALFGRKEESLAVLGIEKITKYVIALINYGHLDLAYHIFTAIHGVEIMIPEAKRYFKKKNIDPIRFLILQLDKLLFLLLHFRKTNNQLMDSDRSWPFR